MVHESHTLFLPSQADVSYDRKGGTERWGLLKALAVSLVLVLSMVLVGCDEEAIYNGPSEAGPAVPTSVPVTSDATVSAITPTTVAQAPATPDPGTSTASHEATPVASPGTGEPPIETVYTVQEGDTLTDIALRYDTSVEVLVQANGLASADTIYVGQSLKIVSASPVAGAAAQPSMEAASVDTPTAVSQQDAASPTQAVVSDAGTPQPAPPTQPVPEPAPVAQPTPVVVNGRTYNAYNQAAIKKGQWYHYTCEFDAAWIVLKTYGYDVGLEEQVEIVGLDTSIEPYYRETAEGTVIYGGDVTVAYSGDYKENFLARSSGQAMSKLFEHYNLKVTPVRDRPSLEAALLRGELVWIKTTVDFKPWREATWVMPDGRSYKTVLGNDHALVVMGFNEKGVVIRDPLGPTSTNWQRKYEYDVPWERFMASWGAQEFDGLAVAPQ
ncbi:MAG TPA: LysM peptidoglycan-binding domain-containing protein [Chloroflexia bacterium]|nr:LysM peptidoglycan-binding domain-containing protein [Chloroflexia bacterium]